MFVTSGRAKIAYDVTGEGPDVLLIHAGVNDRRSWRSVVERLSPRYRCLAFDMRGYGETVYEREEGWSTVADALAVLDAEGARRPLVVACSMGGQAAIDLTLAHPDRVAGLCLIGSAVRRAPYPELTEGPTAVLNAQIEATEDYDEANRLEAWLWLDGPSADEGPAPPGGGGGGLLSVATEAAAAPRPPPRSRARPAGGVAAPRRDQRADARAPRPPRRRGHHRHRRPAPRLD